MKIEEKLINGHLHWRYVADGDGFLDSREVTTEWKPYSVEELSCLVQRLRRDVDLALDEV